MTCKDCIHGDVCGEYDLYPHLYPNGCGDFKNKSDWQEVKHGKWVEKPCMSNSDYMVLHCSECDCTVGCGTRFCSNCGAKMDGQRK